MPLRPEIVARQLSRQSCLSLRGARVFYHDLNKMSISRAAACSRAPNDRQHDIDHLDQPRDFFPIATIEHNRTTPRCQPP